MSDPVLPKPIVSAEELAAILDHVRVLDARSGPRAADYAASHLRGAVHVDLDRDLAAPAPHPERGGRHPLPDLHDLARRLGAWGVTPDTPVVVYDDQGGANAAARVWWMLRSIGHEQVSVLDGGLHAAIEAGLPLEGGTGDVPAAPPYPVPAAWKWPLADIDEVDRARLDPDRCVLDVRAATRYRGETETFDPVAGHVPGAANIPYSENLDERGRFRSPVELRAMYDALLAGRAPSALVVHCGSGVTACHTLLALDRAGLAGAALYVGSWSEWCRTGREVGRGGGRPDGA